MDPSSQDFQEDLKACSSKSLFKLRWLVFTHKVNESLPEIGPITTLITLGEILLWFVYPPELQSQWTTLAALWACAWLACIGIISIPLRMNPEYRAHWLSGD